MDTIKSFKGYGKVDPLEEQAFRRKTRKRLTILIISTVILLAVIGAVAGTLIRNRNSSSSSSSTQTSPATSLKSVCSVTQYPDSCFSSIQALESSNTISDPQQIFKLSLQVVLNEITKISSFPQTLISRINDASIKSALTVCQTMIDDVKDRLNDSISSFDNKALSMQTISDLETWLSAVITDQETCFDALLELNNSAPVLNDVKSVMKNSTEFASNSLAIVAQILGILGNFNIPVHRKLLSTEFPDWFGAADRRLLQETSVEANLTVASDGSGNYKTINEAVAKVPRKSKERFVIYVKAGLYVENVNLDKNARNVMMYGDGMDKTIISGSLNFVDGTPTFSTATFAVVGSGFIARDLAFKNTAGAEKHQAVALRSGSDMSVFYRCSFDAFQDTLYAHSNRQFYRECNITGTIDFIFGNSAVVFQNCNILPRQPMANQFVTITAQGKSDENQNTGISIQKCTMSPLDDLTASAYLGRPWKNYATTVIMQTNIGSFLTPAGWYPWVSNVVPPKTIFYAEFQNTGSGSNVTNRVTWPGYKPSITPIQASKYTVKSFINGDEWLQNTNVMYDTSL